MPEACSACSIWAFASTRRNSGVTFSLSWASPNRFKRLLTDLVARAPARVQVKLLLAFLTRVRQEYDQFTAVITHVVELVRGGRTTEAREIQVSQIVPLADRLERLTNQLVNVAEADMVGAIDASARAYRVSQFVVIAF